MIINSRTQLINVVCLRHCGLITHWGHTLDLDGVAWEILMSHWILHSFCHLGQVCIFQNLLRTTLHLFHDILIFNESICAASMKSRLTVNHFPIHLLQNARIQSTWWCSCRLCFCILSAESDEGYQFFQVLGLVAPNQMSLRCILEQRWSNAVGSLLVCCPCSRASWKCTVQLEEAQARPA